MVFIQISAADKGKCVECGVWSVECGVWSGKRGGWLFCSFFLL